jgi:hypothetical protein
MVICLIALVVFSIAGLWSVKYRQLAKEAFDCTFRMVTFRPCRTNLDERIKAKVTSKLIGRFPSLAKAFYKNFKIFSWIFVLIFFGSMIYTAYTIYNLIVYGTCDPNSTTCIITAPFVQILGCGYETLFTYTAIIVLLILLIFLVRKYLKLK